MEEIDTQATEAQKAADRLMAVAGRLQGLALEQIGLKRQIEERWHEDLRQYNGEYDEEIIKTLKANEQSQLFVNITRPKTRTVESRLADMLFGSDDRNFAIKPTPVPTLQAQQQQVDEQGQPIPRKTLMMQAVDAAREAAEAMESKIDDQLREADYARHARAAIHDSAVLGTGIIKGPVVIGRTRRVWKRDENGQMVDEPVVDTRPVAERVDPWNFFPDMGAARIQDANFAFERAYFTGLQMRGLLEDDYFSREAVIESIRAGAQRSQLSKHPTTDKREAAGELSSTLTANDNYEVWTYWGPLTHSELRAAEVDVPEELPDETEVMACVVMCGDQILKAMLAPEKRELPYSVFNYETDENSIFGVGIPCRMRSSQTGLNAAVRALMDNAGLSVGPQYIFNEALIEPVDGDYLLKPKKGWRLTDRNRSVNEVFRTIDLSAHHGELMNLVQMWSRFADEETGIPLIAAGEQGPHITKTANGMAMLMNAANVVIRSIVRNWDDGVTIPLIGRFYTWNMKHAEDDALKGDFEVDARGSTVLLAKEIQSQNLMTLALQFAGHPIFGPMTKHAELYRKTVSAMSIPADEVILTDQEIEAMQQQAAEAPQPEGDGGMQLEQAKHQMAMERLQAEWQFKAQIAEMEREAEMASLANDRQMSVDELAAMLQKARIAADASLAVAQVRKQ